MLHDAVADEGGDETAELIGARFGPRVTDMVLHCTDSAPADPSQKRLWPERKTAYIERLAHV